MELRAIIIDDEIDGIKSLRLVIEKYVKGINVIAVTTDPAEGVTFIENYRPDLVFLDIRMPGMDGLQLLERLSFRSFYLVFTTAHEEYALAGLKKGAIDYLLKPVDADDLEETIARIRKKQAEQHKDHDVIAQLSSLFPSAERHQKIALSDKEGTVYCDPDEIIRLEANSNYTRVLFRKRNPMLISRTLKEFEKQLCFEGSPFLRVHQSHIVNMNHCLRYKKEEGGIIQLVDDSIVPLSANRKETFLHWINIT